MAALTTPNTFSAGAKIVATQMNANFSNIVTWVAQTPTFSVSGSLTTIAGTLQVTEASTFQAKATFQGASPMEFTGATTGNGHTTTFAITDPSTDRTITFPDADGTVALSGSSVTSVTGTAPIVSSGGATPAISITTNNDQLLLNNQIFS